MASLRIPLGTRSRREPEKTVLFRVLAAELETFLERIDSDPTRAGLPGFVIRELRAFLRCGLLQYGFARVFCPACKKDSLVALSCKGRGFCPSCGARRMADTAAWLVDRVLPNVPVRQWVVTFPHRIRFLCACDPELCSDLRRIVVRAISSFLKRRAKARGIDDPRVGAIVFCQRFDQALRLNLHMHMLWPDGAFECAPFAERATFHRDDPLTDADIEKLVATIRSRVVRLLRKRGLLPDDEAPPDDDLDPSPLKQLAAAAVQGKLALGPDAGAPTPRIGRRRETVAPRTKKKLCAECDGFTLHANVCIAQGATERLEQLARYAARPPIVEDRLSLSADGTHVIYRFRRPFRDGTTHVVLSCQEFVARLAALIPRPRAHLVTYHGVFAPAASYRDRIVPDPPEDHFETAKPEPCSHRGADNAAPGESKPRKRRPYAWAELFKRVFRLDVLVCDRCGGPRKLLAAILEADVIRKVLAHLGLAPEPPPVDPARPPPGHDELLFA